MLWGFPDAVLALADNDLGRNSAQSGLVGLGALTLLTVSLAGGWLAQIENRVFVRMLLSLIYRYGLPLHLRLNREVIPLFRMLQSELLLELALDLSLVLEANFEGGNGESVESQLLQGLLVGLLGKTLHILDGHPFAADTRHNRGHDFGAGDLDMLEAGDLVEEIMA